MSEIAPTLLITGPDGATRQVPLHAERTTIGRLPDQNDIALADPQRLISRQAHCTIVRDGGLWWVYAQGTNPVHLRRAGLQEPIHGRAPLSNGATILILATLDEAEARQYWEITFHDPHGTVPAGTGAGALQYEHIQARLYRLENGVRREITDLRPQEHRLIRYMDERNRAAGGVPALCTYAELISAVWGEEPGRTEAEINHLIYELRRKLEPDPRNPAFLETVRGLGYRLVCR